MGQDQPAASASPQAIPTRQASPWATVGCGEGFLRVIERAHEHAYPGREAAHVNEASRAFQQAWRDSLPLRKRVPLRVADAMTGALMILVGMLIVGFAAAWLLARHGG